MAVVYDDAGWITEVAVRSAAVTRKLATFERDRLTTISFSPDLKSVVSDRPLTLASGVPDLKVIETDGLAIAARWHPNYSKFFVVSSRPAVADAFLVAVYDAQQKIGGGALPTGHLYRDGWFANSHALYLYLGLVRDEFGVGVIWQCQIRKLEMPSNRQQRARGIGRRRWHAGDRSSGRRIFEHRRS